MSGALRDFLDFMRRGERIEDAYFDPENDERLMVRIRSRMGKVAVVSFPMKLEVAEGAPRAAADKCIGMAHQKLKELEESTQYYVE